MIPELTSHSRSALPRPLSHHIILPHDLLLSFSHEENNITSEAVGRGHEEAEEAGDTAPSAMDAVEVREGAPVAGAALTLACFILSSFTWIGLISRSASAFFCPWIEFFLVMIDCIYEFL